MKSLPKISIVAPLYNETSTFPHLVERLKKLMNTSELALEVVLVDDGSEDNTALLMTDLALSDARFQCVFLARNFGHQLALSAGMKVARGTEALFIIDGDLQDPPELLSEFREKLQEGYEVVYGVRKKRKESFLKKASYFLYYRILDRISEVPVAIDSGDFSMISRRMANILNNMPESSRYLRGMRSWAGLKHIGLEYERDERIAGSTKYSWRDLFRLAYNGIFNFSDLPLKLITNIGVFSIGVSLVYFIAVLYKKYVLNDIPTGYTGLLFAIILFGGVQLVSLGIIGEYVSRIFFQAKGRPLFVIRNKIIDQENIESKKGE